VDLASNVATTLLSGLPLGNPAKILIGDGRPLVGTDLIVADWNTEYNSPCCAGRVYRINPQTGSVSILANANPAFSPPGDPFGLALGPGGPWGTSLYVMDFEGNSPNPPVLYRVSDGPTSTTFLIKPDIWTTNQQPQALAFSPGNGFGNDLVELSLSPDGQSLYAAIGDTIIKISAATLTVPAPGVLSNDQPSTSSPLGAMLAAGTTRGTLDFHADGSFTFLAGTNFQG